MTTAILFFYSKKSKLLRNDVPYFSQWHGLYLSPIRKNATIEKLKQVFRAGFSIKQLHAVALFRCFWPVLTDSMSAGQCCGNQSCIEKVPLFIRGKGFQIGLGILIIQFSGLLKVFHGLFCFAGQQINPAAAIEIQAVLGFQLKGFVN